MLFIIRKRIPTGKYNNYQEIIDAFCDISNFIVNIDDSKIYLKQKTKPSLLYNSFAPDIIIHKLNMVEEYVISFKLSFKVELIIYILWSVLAIMSIMAIITGTLKLILIFLIVFLYSCIFSYICLFFSSLKYKPILND